MIKKVTAIQIHPTNVGEQMAFAYSIIDDTGKIIEQNKRYEIVILDHEILDLVSKLYSYANDNIPKE